MISRKLGIGVVKTVMVAALYAVALIMMGPLAWGPFEFRIPDMLCILPFLSYFGWSAAIGVTLGGAIASLFGPWGIADLALGIVSGITIVPFTVWAGQQARKKPAEKRFWLIVALLQILVFTAFWIGYVMLHKMIGIPAKEAVGGVFLSGFINIVVAGYFFHNIVEKIFPNE